MASSPKLVCLILLITLSFSLEIYGRESQFFSKVTRNRDPATTNTKDEEFVHLNKQEELQEQPAFIPQTTETGYGLYGHDNEYHQNNYAPELKGLSSESETKYNGGVEKQGISDTSVLDNAKYYYHVNAEKNYDANNNNFNNNNYNNNNGYYGNRENNYEYYNNNNNRENGMQGFQNQVPEEEFDFDQP